LEKLRRGNELSDEELELLLRFLIVIEDSGYSDFPNIDRALAKKRTKPVLKSGEVWIVMRRYRLVDEHGRNIKRIEFVIHQIFGKNGSLKHLGIKGVRGWSIEDRDRVDFYHRGHEYEFWHYAYGQREDRWRKKRK